LAEIFLVLEQKSYYFELLQKSANKFLTINGKQSLFLRTNHRNIIPKMPLTSQYLVDFVDRHFFAVRKVPCTSLWRCSLLGVLNDFAN